MGSTDYGAANCRGPAASTASTERTAIQIRDLYCGGRLSAGYSRRLGVAPFDNEVLDRRATARPASNPKALHPAGRGAGAVPFKLSGRKGSIPAIQREGDRVFADHTPRAG